MIQHSKPKRTREEVVRFPGITADAQTLGVTRVHLYLVLGGDRPSPGLLRRYHALKAQQQQEAAK